MTCFTSTVIVPGNSNNTPRTVHHNAMLLQHPDGQPAFPNAVVFGNTEPPAIHPVLFESIDAAVIKNASFSTSGAAGPSGIDVRGWGRFCSSFHSATNDLCNSLVQLSQRLCTEYINPGRFSALFTNQLIALNKSLGVCPIRICEVGL